METPERLSFQRLSVSSPSTPQSSSSTKLWRPAAQRNIRNQWSKLAACRQRWASASSNGRSQATSLVNAYLSEIYLPDMKLGVLSDFPNIRKKAQRKLFKQQELQHSKLLITYKDLVSIVLDMINISRSMRCYNIGATGSPLAQFSNCSNSSDDVGDGGGVTVFRNWNILQFELLADELIQMFKVELDIKRRLVVELLSISSKNGPVDNCELYPGESEDWDHCTIDSTGTDHIPESFCRVLNNKTTKVDGEAVSKVMEVG